MFKRHSRDNNPGIKTEKVDFRYHDGSRQLVDVIVGSVVEAQPAKSGAEKVRKLAHIARNLGSAALAKANVAVSKAADRARTYAAAQRERSSRAWEMGDHTFTETSASGYASFGRAATGHEAASAHTRPSGYDTFVPATGTPPSAQEDISQVYDRVMTRMGGGGHRRPADPWQAARGHYDTYQAQATAPHAAPKQPGTIYYGHNHTQM